MSHLNDARILTERQGADPHRWPEVMARLPLLERRQHYQTLRHGYARGSEAALYVQHVRHYYHLLQWLETLYGALLRPAVGYKPTRIGFRQLGVSTLFTLVFIAAWLVG